MSTLSENQIRHGLNTSILSVREDPREFDAILAAWTDQLHPETEVERRLVRRIAATDFRLDRIVLIEANLLDAEIDARGDELDKTWTDLNHAGRMALSFRDAVRDSNVFEQLRRSETMLERAIARTVRLVLELQKTRREQEAEKENPQIEPTELTESDRGAAKITPCVSAGPPSDRLDRKEENHNGSA